MTAKEAIQHSINTGHMLLTTYLGDLSDSDLMLRAVPGMNHIAWQLGHLITSEHKMMSDAGFTMPALPDGMAESYSKETSTSDDAGKFLKKDEYLQLLDKQREATMRHIDSATDDQLAAEAPEAMRAYAPTVGVVFNMIGVHTMMHVGQFVAVRRKLDKPVTI